MEMQVCAICFKSIPQRDKVFNTGESSSSIRVILPTLAPDRRSTPETEGATELCCYVCHRMNNKSAMQMLSCYPDRSRNSSPHRVMHFPFLKTLPSPSGPAYFDANNRTLVCIECFTYFSHQWRVFESDGLPLELRHYTLPPVVHRPSLPLATLVPPRLEVHPSSPTHAGSSSPHSTALKTVTQSQPVSPSLRQSLVVRNRPVQSTTPINADRRPPSSNRNSPANPSPAPSSGLVGNDGHHNSTELSIYCYLCGLNSTRSFAHWLPSAASPTDPAMPYFPYLLNYAASSRAEGLREDGAALVCTFCYHMVK